MKTVFHSQGKGDEGEPDPDDDGNFLGPWDARVQTYLMKTLEKIRTTMARRVYFGEGHGGRDE
jgi:hypothetical protein